MTKKIFGITVLSFVLYTILLSCFGLFGTAIQNYTIQYGLIVLKYGLVLFGFALTLFLPIRIHKALLERGEEKYQRESNAKITAIANQEKKRQENIMKELYNQEDSI